MGDLEQDINVEQDIRDSLFATEFPDAFESTFVADLDFVNTAGTRSEAAMNPGYVLLMFVAAVAFLFCARMICSEDKAYLINLKTKERTIESVTGCTYSDQTIETPRSQQAQTDDVLFHIHISDRPPNHEEETSDESEISEPVPTELATIYERHCIQNVL